MPEACDETPTYAVAMVDKIPRERWSEARFEYALCLNAAGNSLYVTLCKGGTLDPCANALPAAVQSARRARYIMATVRLSCDWRATMS